MEVERYTYIVGFEIFTAVSMKMSVFWVVARCRLAEAHCPDDRGSKYLLNVGKLLPD
jgi:hypothetical protein